MFLFISVYAKISQNVPDLNKAVPGMLPKITKNMASMVNQKQRKQTSLLARDDPILSAKHFLPSSELPPYPDPKEMMSLVAGR